MTKNLDQLDDQIKGYGGNVSSDRFEFKEGENRMRILTFPEVLATHFVGGRGGTAHTCVGIEDGCKFHGVEDKAPSLKLVSYIIDRVDGKVKLAELPLSVRYSLKDLQEDSDFEFVDFPMPYDVKIKHDPQNSDPKAKYRLMGSPNKADLTQEEEEGLAEAMGKLTPEQYVEKKKAKERGNLETTQSTPAESEDKIKYPEEKVDPKDIPF